MTSKTNHVCKDCGVELNDENWYPSNQKNRNYICKNCDREKHRQWEKANPEKVKAQWTHKHRKRGMRSFDENKECSSYLGVFVAERVLSHVFKHVEQMPMNNPGFDFICGQGYKIDVKSACKGKNRNKWMFHIRHNTITDYFLCLAFDNREDLNPLYIWLIPGDNLNHLVGTSISSSTIHKWDEYRLDVTKVATCCNAIRSGDQQKHEHR